MELSFQYTKEEWVAGRRKYLFLSKTITKLQIFVTFAFWIVWSVSLGILGFRPMYLALGGILAVCTLLLVFLYFIQPAMLFRATAKYRHPYQMRFAQETIQFETQGITSVLSWEIYTDFWETDRFFYLLQNKGQYAFIPKRAFASDDDLVAFRALLLSHFPKSAPAVPR